MNFFTNLNINNRSIKLIQIPTTRYRISIKTPHKITRNQKPTNYIIRQKNTNNYKTNSNAQNKPIKLDNQKQKTKTNGQATFKIKRQKKKKKVTQKRKIEKIKLQIRLQYQRKKTINKNNRRTCYTNISFKHRKTFKPKNTIIKQAKTKNPITNTIKILHFKKLN